MTYFIILFVTILTISSQLLLKKAINNTNIILDGNYFKYIYAVLTSPYVISAIIFQGIGFILWIFVINKLKLGIAFALSGSFFYILTALLSWYFFGEEIKAMQWAGLFFISFGVILLTVFN